MTSKSKIAFVCLHGSAKSLIAAELAARFAKARGLDMLFTSGGTEPDQEVPPHVVAGLDGDGISTNGIVPQRATAAQLADARLVVTFGPDITSLAPAGTPIVHWDDLPNVDAGYGRARTAIRERIEALLAGL